MRYNWISVLGQFLQEDESIIFKGGSKPIEDGRLLSDVGNFICDRTFGGGIIPGEIEFLSSVENEDGKELISI
jgi:hypothetical protein